MNIFAFDIETVPDTAGGAAVHGLSELDDDAIAAAMLAQRRARTGGSEFLPHYLHRVVVISVAALIGDRFRVFSLGEAGDSEASVVQRFFDGLDRYRPRLVSWNGSGFDLPVLHYRALRYGVRAPCYWENGDNERQFRWNNYLNRFHEAHLDLMDVLSGYQGRACAPLDDIAVLCGLPGKMGLSGAGVQDAVASGHHDQVRRYCEVDVLNTYLLYLRFELMRGHLDETGYNDACERVRASLAAMEEPHTRAFLEAWTGEHQQQGDDSDHGST